MCFHKPDTPTFETTLVFIAELVSFFPCYKLFVNPPLSCYISSHLLTCCINIICLLIFYLHHYLFFLKVPFTPHSVSQFFCCSLPGLISSNTLFLTLASAQLPSCFPFLIVLLCFFPCSLLVPLLPRSPSPPQTGVHSRHPAGLSLFPLTQTSSHEQKIHTAAEGP